jgi:RNA polymerase sigma factor (sigma-70 family)
MPDDPFLEGEILEKAGRLRRALSSLPPRERQVLLLRYGRGWSARKIADGLRLKGPRRVYGIIDRAIERLRKAFLGEKR